MSNALFDAWNLWFALCLSGCMVAALGTLVVFMVSEMWHPMPHYKHEHDAEWIKANTKK